MNLEEICKSIGADSLGYLSVDGVKKMASDADCDFCTGMFLQKKYPAPIPKHSEKSKFEMKIEKKESKHDEEL